MSIILITLKIRENLLKLEDLSLIYFYVNLYYQLNIYAVLNIRTSPTDYTGGRVH